ncbi:MAG TPA: hypothetical protein VFI40_04925 [Nocardioides sp.]|nr:hypothetical protein [Nocardioides sp.]
MKPLSQELAEDQRLGTSCLLCSFVARQPRAEEEEWHTALAQPVTVVSHASILRALHRRGVAITEGSVKRHRRNHA